MNNKFLQKTIICLSLFILTFATRLIVAPGNNSYTSYDSGNYCLAAISYSIQNDRPHMPGYYLYVQLIKFMYSITNNFYYSILLLSVLFSSLAAIFIFLILLYYFNMKQSVLLTLIILFNPLVWFYSASTDIYIFDLFFAAVVFFSGIHRNGIYLLPILIAIGIGVRQSTGVFLIPLCLYFYYMRIRDKEIDWLLLFTSFVPGILAFFLWFIPMINSTGGINNYIELSKNHVPLPRTVITGGIPTLLRNVTGAVSYSLFLSIPTIITLFAFVLIKVFRRKFTKNSPGNIETNQKDIISGFNKIKSNKDTLFQLCFWLVPASVFFIFIYYTKGYSLLVFPVIIIIPAIFLVKKVIGNKILLLILLFQLAVFMLYPSNYPHYELQSNYEHRTLSKIEMSIGRLTSYYSMSYSNLKKIEMYYKEIDSLLTKSGLNIKNYIFIDPIVIPNQRVLQLIYPERTFLKYDNTMRNRYWLYHGIDNTEYNDFESALGYSAIITSNLFFNKFLKNFAKEYIKSQHFTLFIPKQDNIGDIKKTYDKYYLRIGY